VALTYRLIVRIRAKKTVLGTMSKSLVLACQLPEGEATDLQRSRTTPSAKASAQRRPSSRHCVIG